MTDYPIPASAIEAAARALANGKEDHVHAWLPEAEKAFRAAFDDLRMEIREGRDPTKSSYDRSYRFVSRWMPVEKP